MWVVRETLGLIVSYESWYNSQIMVCRRGIHASLVDMCTLRCSQCRGPWLRYTREYNPSSNEFAWTWTWRGENKAVIQRWFCNVCQRLTLMLRLWGGVNLLQRNCYCLCDVNILIVNLVLIFILFTNTVVYSVMLNIIVCSEILLFFQCACDISIHILNCFN